MKQLSHQFFILFCGLFVCSVKYWVSLCLHRINRFHFDVENGYVCGFPVVVFVLCKLATIPPQSLYRSCRGDIFHTVSTTCNNNTLTSLRFTCGTNRPQAVTRPHQLGYRVALSPFAYLGWKRQIPPPAPSITSRCVRSETGVCCAELCRCLMAHPPLHLILSSQSLDSGQPALLPACLHW